MSSWHYAYLFQNSDDKLKPQSIVHYLSCRGLEFDNNILMSVEIDDDGHLEDVGDEIMLSSPVIEDLSKRLVKNEQFLATCRNSELYFACGFATNSKNPYICIGWQKKLFASLEKSAQKEYLQMIRKSAKAVDAGYVIFVDDPPDYFEDRFLLVDGERYLDTQMPDGAPYEIHEIWLDKKVIQPVGIKLYNRKNIGDGFISFSIESGE